MAATTMISISERFIDKCDPDDPEYQRDLIRPVEIKEDVKLMEQRKRVSIILKSKTFCKELEDVIRRQCQNCGISDSSTSLLSVNHISEQLLLAALPRKTTSAIGVGVSTNGIIPINDLRDGLMSYGRTERQLRCKVAAIHRLMDMFSWCNGSQHYVTARLSKDQDKFLIKPFGIFFHEVTASCLISIDSKGYVKDPGSTVLSADESNWSFHAAIHVSRPDIGCLIHLRTYAAMCVSGSPKGLLPLSLEAVLLGDVGIFVPKSDYSDLESVNSFNNLRNEIAEVLAPQKKIMILPNHGIFVGGATVEEAWFLVQRVQKACEVQEALYKLDLDELYLPDKDVQIEMINYFQDSFEAKVDEKSEDEKISEKYLHKYRIGQIEFEAMMRHLDNSGYRTGYFYQQKDIYKNMSENGLSPVSKYPDVEIPPVCSSLAQNGAQYDDNIVSGDEMEQKKLSLQREMSETYSKTWFNTPNTYKLDSTLNSTDTFFDINPTKMSSNTPEHRPARWISANPAEKAGMIPHHPVTPGAHVSILSAAANSAPVTPAKVSLKGIDPKELKAKQKKVKDRYYFDTNTPGPQSCLLDGLTWEETRRVREEGMTKYLGKEHGEEPLITAASKGIVQRGHKDRAIVLEGVFKPANPFEKVTDDDLVKYREEVDRKNHPELYLEPEIVTSKSETDLITPVNVEMEKSMPPVSSISLDDSVAQQIIRQKDTGMTSDSDFPGDSSAALNSVTAPADTIPGAITSETSAAEISHDDIEKDTTSDKPKKKKKKLFKSIFSKKKKKQDEKK